MRRVETTPAAHQDLVEIAHYTALSQDSIEAAREFVWMLQDKFLLLA
jgi:plasmid stabilization system protein ParE